MARVSAKDNRSGSLTVFTSLWPDLGKEFSFIAYRSAVWMVCHLLKRVDALSLGNSEFVHIRSIVNYSTSPQRQNLDDLNLNLNLEFTLFCICRTD